MLYGGGVAHSVYVHCVFVCAETYHMRDPIGLAFINSNSKLNGAKFHCTSHIRDIHVNSGYHLFIAPIFHIISLRYTMLY